MDTITKLELVSEDMSVCRSCLATNTKLYSISDGLEDNFIQLMGVEYSDDDGLPQHLCPYCRMQLLRFADLRRRCLQSQTLLRQMLKQQCFLSTDDVIIIDRDYYKLGLNLVKLNVYSFSSLDKKSNLQPEDIGDDAFDDGDELPEEDIRNELIDPLIIEQNTPNLEVQDIRPVDKQTTIDIDKPKPKNLVVEIDGLNLGQMTLKNLLEAPSLKPFEARGLKTVEATSLKTVEATSLKTVEATSLETVEATSIETLETKENRKKEKKKQKVQKEVKRKQITNLLRFVVGKKRNEEPLTKRQLQLRRPDNNFLPNFDHAEFESEHDCKIRILTMEEQLQEIAERRESSNYLNLDYKCESCGRGFEFDQSYKNHMAKHDPNIGKFECEVCHVYFRTQYLRHRHLDYHKMMFVCNLCGFVTRAKHLARNHYLMHTGKVFKCKQCDATFTKSTSYYGHVRINHPSSEHVCTVCGDSFIGALGLRHHAAKAHKEPPKPKLACKTCKVQFVSLEAKSTHTDGKRCNANMKACAECGSVFDSEEALKSHADIVHVPARYWCLECEQSFLSQASLDTHHQRIHLRIKWPAYGRTREMNRAYYKKIKERTRLKSQVVCEICGVKLMSNAALERHQLGQCKRERNTKSYKCPFCLKACATRQGLQLHVTLHTGEKPHKCAECPQAFRQAGALKRHHKAVHLGIDTRVQCGHCGKYFSTPSTRKLHVNTVHLGLPQPARRRPPRGAASDI